MANRAAVTGVTGVGALIRMGIERTDDGYFDSVGECGAVTLQSSGSRLHQRHSLDLVGLQISGADLLFRVFWN